MDRRQLPRTEGRTGTDRRAVENAVERVLMDAFNSAAISYQLKEGISRSKFHRIAQDAIAKIKHIQEEEAK